MRIRSGRAVALAASAVAVAALAAGWWLWSPFAAKGPGAGERAALVRSGAEVYAAHCAACHGESGEGQPDWRRRKADGKLPAPPLNGSGHTWHHPDGQLIDIISKGVAAIAPAGYQSDMRGFGDTLSDREIRAVLAYIKQWWPEDARSRQREITERAESAK